MRLRCPRRSRPTFETPPTGLTAAEVRNASPRGAVERHRRAHQPHRRRDRPGERLHPLQRDPRHDARRDPRGRARSRTATFGIVLVRERADRHRPGVARQAHARPARGARMRRRARVVRDGNVTEIAVEEVVLDDLLELRAGDQVPCDGVGAHSRTGSRSTSRCSPASPTRSTSIRATRCFGQLRRGAGSGRFQATRVGAEAYARKLAAEARRFTLTRSELMDGINLILRIVTCALIPTSALLLWSQLRRLQPRLGAARAWSPASWAWCPKGWCCSRASRSGSPRSRSPGARCSCRSCPRSKGSARVDVVCLDKTGTLTEGEIVFDEIEPLDDDRRHARPRRARRRREPQRDARRARRRVHARPTGGRAPRRCRSRRRGSGARRASRVTARG